MIRPLPMSIDKRDGVIGEIAGIEPFAANQGAVDFRGPPWTSVDQN